MEEEKDREVGGMKSGVYQEKAKVCDSAQEALSTFQNTESQDCKLNPGVSISFSESNAALNLAVKCPMSCPRYHFYGACSHTKPIVLASGSVPGLQQKDFKASAISQEPNVIARTGAKATSDGTTGRVQEGAASSSGTHSPRNVPSTNTGTTSLASATSKAKASNSYARKRRAEEMRSVQFWLRPPPEDHPLCTEREPSGKEKSEKDKDHTKQPSSLVHAVASNTLANDFVPKWAFFKFSPTASVDFVYHIEIHWLTADSHVIDDFVNQLF